MPLKKPFWGLGKWEHPVYGDLNITQDKFDQMLANFKNNVLADRHLLEAAMTKGLAISLAMFRQKDDILYAEVEPTTPEAEENIRTKGTWLLLLSTIQTVLIERQGRTLELYFPLSP